MFTFTLASQAIEQSSGSVMPALGRDRVVSARVLPTTGVVNAALAVSDADFRGSRGTAVCAYAHVKNDAITGVFPGIPAWSPPI